MKDTFVKMISQTHDSEYQYVQHKLIAYRMCDSIIREHSPDDINGFVSVPSLSSISVQQLPKLDVSPEQIPHVEPVQRPEPALSAYEKAKQASLFKDSGVTIETFVAGDLDESLLTKVESVVPAYVLPTSPTLDTCKITMHKVFGSTITMLDSGKLSHRNGCQWNR